MKKLNRNRYLQLYKDGLLCFEESYSQKKVLELDEEITKLVDSGKSEEEAIQSLGSIDEHIKKVKRENHVRIDTIQKKDNFFTTKAEGLWEIVNRIIDVMSKNSAKANGKIILDILILIFLVCIIKIPFILIRDVGERLLAFLSIPILLNLWHFVIEILYVVLAIVVFLNIFKRWFHNLKISK